MSLTSALSTALSGLQSATVQLQLTANNISNANTPGYTAKKANLTAAAFGGAGAGVTITGFTRAASDALFKSYNAATSESSLLGTQDSYLKQVQTILDSTDSNPALSDAISKFSAAWTALQAEPESSIKQTAVVQAGTNLASIVGNTASQISALDRQVKSDLSSNVTRLNNDLTQVQTLNTEIASAMANNQSPGDFEDQRDTLVNDISSLTNVNILSRSNGGIALYTSDGVPLIDGQPQTFSYDGGTNTITGGGGQDVTANLSGGALQASIQFRATAVTPSTSPAVNVIQKLNDQLSAIVSAFTSRTNPSGATTFAAAYNPANTSGADFFTATGTDPATFAVNSNLISGASSIPQANVTATANTFSASFNFTASGLSLTGATYATLGTNILSNFQQAANTVDASSQSAAQQQKFYQQSLTNATGVNVDSELVNLTTLQNSYAASAHVISTISDMFKTLISIL